MAFKTIHNSADVYELLKESLINEENENLLMISLNSACHVRQIDWLTTGSDTQTVFSKKQIARTALLNNACAVIMVHNHPSGSTRPSFQDDQATSELKKTLELIEVRLIDHVIIGAGEGGFYSYADQGKI